MATTEAENKELVDGFYEEVMDGGNVNRIDEYIAEEFVLHNPVMEDAHGPEEYKAVLSMFHAAFPDMEHITEDVIAEGNKVVRRNRLTGTHEGELMGIEPTGNPIENPGIAIFKIIDGLIVEQWVQADMMGLMEQLGVQ